MFNVLTYLPTIKSIFNIHRLHPGLLEYLILFATQGFVSQRQLIIVICLHYEYSFKYRQMSPLLLKFQ